jgi:hypothetical protein
LLDQVLDVFAGRVADPVDGLSGVFFDPLYSSGVAFVECKPTDLRFRCPEPHVPNARVPAFNRASACFAASTPLAFRSSSISRLNFGVRSFSKAVIALSMIE